MGDVYTLVVNLTAFEIMDLSIHRFDLWGVLELTPCALISWALLPGREEMIPPCIW